jgi:thiamine transporter
MVAVAVVLDLLCKLIPTDAFLPFGGSISIGVVPILFISFRHGWAWGGGTALVFVGIQMITGFYAPPIANFGYYLLMILLDYVLAYGIMGFACIFASPFKNRLVGYTVATAITGAIRFVCSFFSGVLIWNGNFYVDEGEAIPSLLSAISDGGAWIYSLGYNGGYMLPTVILCCVVVAILCSQIDPLTLKRPVKKVD